MADSNVAVAEGDAGGRDIAAFVRVGQLDLMMTKEGEAGGCGERQNQSLIPWSISVSGKQLT